MLCPREKAASSTIGCDAISSYLGNVTIYFTRGHCGASWILNPLRLRARTALELKHGVPLRTQPSTGASNSRDMPDGRERTTEDAPIENPQTWHHVQSRHCSGIGHRRTCGEATAPSGLRLT